MNNGGGLAPGPADWDIRLVAKVPADQLDSWISPGMTVSSAPETDWHSKVGTEIDVANVSEWHNVDGCSVGLDRTNLIVVYRNITR